MGSYISNITGDERDFYGPHLIFLEGAISEFLSCVEMIRRYQISLGRRDPIASVQARIKSAASLREKLRRHGLPETVESAMEHIRDAAGVRLICPFVQDIYTAAGLIRAVPGVELLAEKDYIHTPKANGYRSYHIILTMPLRFAGEGGVDGPVPLEVQLRTIAMDCWANIEHQLKYKRDIPHQGLIVEELKRCADEISSTDLSLQTIRDLIEHPTREET